MRMEEEENNGNQEIIVTLLKYFFLDYRKRSQNQQCDLLNDFHAFIKCFPKKEKEYKEVIREIENKPVAFFIKHNKGALSSTEEKKIDIDFSLASLDFLFFRDTSIANQLKTSYAVTYSRPTRDRRSLTLAQLLDVMRFIRKYLYSETVAIAKEMRFDIPFVRPDINPLDQNQQEVGL